MFIVTVVISIYEGAGRVLRASEILNNSNAHVQNDILISAVDFSFKVTQLP